MPVDDTAEIDLTDGGLLSQVVAGLRHGVVVHDPSGAIVAHNEAALDILGLSHDELVGRTSMDPRWRATRADGSDFPGDEHPAMVALRTGEVARRVLMGVERPDGTRRWIHIDAFPIDFEVGSRGVCVTFTDVTDQARTDG